MSDEPPQNQHGSVLIIGASRGIGLGLAEAHARSGWIVHATTRSGSVEPAHHTHHLDVRDEGQLKALIASAQSPFDRLIHNAGIISGTRKEIMDVNAEAPIRVVDQLLDAGMIASGGTIALMTSQMGARRGRSGSLGDYGDSKAALNDAFRSRVGRWGESGRVAVVIHPGWVRTDMGGDNASISVEESVRGVIGVLDRLSTDEHGRFLTWEGAEHPW